MEVLKCNVRQETGSAECRRMRNQGIIPANLYSKDGPNTHLSIDSKEFVKFTNRHRGIKVFPISFEKEGKSVETNVMIKEMQAREWKNLIMHLDLVEVRSGEVIEVSVAIHPIGDCIGVKDGGILNHVSDTILVSCTMDKIPRKIDVDITELKPGHALHVEDIELPEGVTAVTPGNQALLTVVETRATKEASDETTEEEGAVEGETAVS